MPGMESTLVPLDPVSLKKRFKELQVETKSVYQNWQIRVHRSLSWYKRSCDLPEDQPDLKFILLWVAFNALYARWDVGKNAPAQDSASRKVFIEKLAELCWQNTSALLVANKSLLKKLLGDPYLSNIFWRDPKHPKAKSWATEDLFHLDRNLKENHHGRVLLQVTDRMYVLRGQLMHGAATGGGKLNRSSLTNCLAMLNALLPQMIYWVIEYRCDNDWPEMCYPPS